MAAAPFGNIPRAEGQRVINEGLSGVPAGQWEQRLALGAVLVSLAVFFALAPFVKTPLARVPEFIAVYEGALVVIDLVTAALLIAQWRVVPTRPLFLLACGYLFTACMTVTHLLTFPGLLGAQGLLGAGEQSTAWLYMFWHAVFPIFVAAYAASKPVMLPPRRALAGALGVLALAAGFAALAIRGEALLPSIMTGHGYLPAYHIIVGLVWFSSLGALLIVLRKRPRTVLDVWVSVVLCVWLCEVALAAVLNAGRFDLGFYAGRAYGLVAAGLVLVGLIYETSLLHAGIRLRGRELQESNARLRASLDEKEVLLKEVHHRVKNNLEMISSLLTLQADGLHGAALESLWVAQNRVHAIGDIHALLYRSGDLANVDLRRFAEGLARALSSLYEGSDGRVSVAVEGELTADIQRAVPLGLILNELLTNSLKHAFPGDRRGAIRVSLSRTNAERRVVVEDDGAGLPRDAAAPPALGLELVRLLVEQLGGTLEIASPPGTRVTVRF